MIATRLQRRARLAGRRLHFEQLGVGLGQQCPRLLLLHRWHLGSPRRVGHAPGQHAEALQLQHRERKVLPKEAEPEAADRLAGSLLTTAVPGSVWLEWYAQSRRASAIS